MPKKKVGIDRPGGGGLASCEWMDAVDVCTHGDAEVHMRGVEGVLCVLDPGKELF